MKTYLVGGAVRDWLLGFTPQERDWVVVGATPAHMLQQGFQQVGRHFPVFLHPETHEEYALARRERKVAAGYYGFTCDAAPEVTLEDDLRRRDLTINAMAIDASGHLIDPYGGQADLKRKYLRHVSDAFIEDPVRVLRLARFLARFYHLGFQVAPETLTLVQRIVRSGELAHLVPERVWQEWARSLAEPHPSQFIKLLRDTGALQVLLPEINALFGVPAAPQPHPEIDTGLHTLQALQHARDQHSSPEVLFAVTLHDVGKALTPQALWPSHPHHDQRGEAPIQAICMRFKIPRLYQDAALLGCRYHLHYYQLPHTSAEQILSFLTTSGLLKHPERFNLLHHLALADIGEAASPLLARWTCYLQACLAVDTAPLHAQSLTGIAFKDALSRLRLDALISILQQEVS